MIYSVLLFLGIMVALCVIICIRASLLRMFSKLDKDAYTPSDYCIMGYNMVFEDYHPKKIEKKIRAVFEEKYNIGKKDIIYINPCYDIGDFYKLSEKFNNLYREKSALEAFMADKKYDEQKMLSIKNSGEFPEDYPTRKTGLCSSEPLIMADLEAEIKQTESEIEEITKAADMDEADS